MAKQRGEAVKEKKATGKRGPGRPPKSEAKEKKTPASGERAKAKKKRTPRSETAIEVAASSAVEAVAMRDLNAVVDKIVEFYKDFEVRGTYELGELVVKELFDGDVDLLHQRGPKSKALSHLLQHQRLPCSPATLSRAVGVYELLTRFPQFKNHKQLALGHLYAVLPLPQEKQEHLLEQAINKKWSAEHLVEEVAKHKVLSGEKRGRHALPAGVKAFGAVERLFDKETALRDLSFVEELETEDATRMKQAVDEIEEWCTQAKKALERKLGVMEVQD